MGACYMRESAMAFSSSCCSVLRVPLSFNIARAPSSLVPDLRATTFPELLSAALVACLLILPPPPPRSNDIVVSTGRLALEEVSLLPRPVPSRHPPLAVDGAMRRGEGAALVRVSPALPAAWPSSYSSWLIMSARASSSSSCTHTQHVHRQRILEREDTLGGRRYRGVYIICVACRRARHISEEPCGPHRSSSFVRGTRLC